MTLRSEKIVLPLFPSSPKKTARWEGCRLNDYFAAPIERQSRLVSYVQSPYEARWSERAMPRPPYDPRAVANLLLELAARDEDGPIPISNLALQKLLYFAHGHFLIKMGVPLLQGAFEAWTYGPVHPAVYQAFRGEGKNPIKMRAESCNVMTGERRALNVPDDPDVRRQLRDVLRSYGHLSAGRLVDITHAPRGPWATVVNKAKTSVALGLRIPDDVTLECFKHQKISVGPQSRVGEPDEDTPLVGN